MVRSMLTWAAILMCPALVLGQEKEPALARLERQIQMYAKTIPGQVGVAIKHIESGQQVLIRGNEKFPMASTFKVPLLVEVMAQEKDGKFSLDDEINIEPKHQHLGSGALRSYRLPGVKLSVKNLCELMIIISDNSATDILLEKAGAENVNARLKAAGIEGISVNRSCQELILDYLGLDSKEHGNKTSAELNKLGLDARALDEPSYATGRQRYYSDGRDSSTPVAMNRLLEKIFKAEILDRERCDRILAIMKRCQTGENRLRGLLPPGAIVAHKTGTVGTTCNDVGILYLPDNAGHVVISVFTKDPKNDRGMYDRARAEKAIAHISRAAYDCFLYAAPVRSQGAAVR